MGDAKVSEDVAGVGRLGTAAAWVSAVCCLRYLFLKIVWTLDVPVGITDRSVLDDIGWVAANALMAVVQLVGLLLVLALTRPWSRRVPAWLLLFPVWVGTWLLFTVVVGAVLMGLFSPPSDPSSENLGGFEPWVYVLVYASFAGQGIALAIAFACHVRSRWGRLLGRRTGDVVARRTARARSWPEGHLTGVADAVAAMTAVVAIVFWYWAAGGSFGLSGAHAQDGWALHASRAVGAVTAGVGLLGLAGRWGRRRRFWLPAALTWLGSGCAGRFRRVHPDVHHLADAVRRDRRRVGLECDRYRPGDQGADRGAGRWRGRRGGHRCRTGRPGAAGAGRGSAPMGPDQGQVTESKRTVARPPPRGLDESVPAPRSPSLPVHAWTPD